MMYSMTLTSVVFYGQIRLGVDQGRGQIGPVGWGEGDRGGGLWLT